MGKDPLMYFANCVTKLQLAILNLDCINSTKWHFSDIPLPMILGFGRLFHYILEEKSSSLFSGTNLHFNYCNW